MAEQESRYPTFEPPYDVAKFPLWSLAKYLQRMRQLDVHRQKHERNSATKHLLSYLKRPANLFPLVRLIFPSGDRRLFSMKELALKKVLATAYSAKRDAINAVGSDKSSFVPAMTQVLCHHAGSFAATSSSFKMEVGPLNERLDRLSATSGSGRAGLLRHLIAELHEEELPVVLYILLQGDRGQDIRCSLRTWLRHLHPDAAAVHEAVIDLDRLCELCKDPTAPVVGRVQVGQKFAVAKAVTAEARGQKAGTAASQARVASSAAGQAQSIVQHLGRVCPGPFVIENKFDGWRVSLHVPDVADMSTASFFTRGRSDAGDAGQELRLLLPAVAAQARFRSAIFDGEICGWDKAAATFTEFRTVRPILNAAGRHAERGTVIASWKARSGDDVELPPRKVEQLEVLYLVFDIVHLDGHLLKELPLRARQAKLLEALADAPEAGFAVEGSPVTLRIVAVVPGRAAPLVPGCEASRLWSVEGSTAEDVQAGFLRVDELDEEGVVVKALGAPYHLGLQPRAAATWLKWKRDYAAEAWEADVLIVGGMWGRYGERHGLSRFVFALRASPDSKRPFITFGRVHAGLTDEQTAEINRRLPELLPVADERGPQMDMVPPWLQVARRQLWPDRWVSDYARSVVITVKADSRMTRSVVFAAGCTLRHARVVAVRDAADKDYATVNTMDDLQNKLRADQQAHDAEEASKKPAKRRPAKRRAAQVAAPYALATSNAEAVCDALAGRHVHILDRSTVNEEEKESLARLVKELGGELTFRLLAKRGTDLCVAGSAPEKQMRGPLRAFVQRFGTEYDVLRHSWLRSCRARGRLARASPADFVHLSDKTMMERVESDGFDKWGTEIDAYPDDEDALALLTTHAARAKAVWDVKRALAQRAVTKAERAEQAAALGAPEPASAAEVQETAREVVRAGKDTKLLRSVALAGCAVVLLMHASPWSACQPRAAEGTPLGDVACAWMQCVYQRGGDVVAVSAYAPDGLQQLLGAPDGPAAMAAATHVVLLPDGESAAAACLQGELDCTPAPGAALDSVAAEMTTTGMAGWAPDTLAAALSQACSTPERLAVLLERLLEGEAAFVSGAWLAGAPPALDQRALGWTTAGVPQAVREGAPTREALAAFLEGLKWPEAGLRSAVRGKTRAALTGRKRKRPARARKQAKPVAVESDDDMSLDAPAQSDGEPAGCSPGSQTPADRRAEPSAAVASPPVTSAAVRARFARKQPARTTAAVATASPAADMVESLRGSAEAPLRVAPSPSAPVSATEAKGFLVGRSLHTPPSPEPSSPQIKEVAAEHSGQVAPSQGGRRRRRERLIDPAFVEDVEPARAWGTQSATTATPLVPPSAPATSPAANSAHATALGTAAAPPVTVPPERSAAVAADSPSTAAELSKGAKAMGARLAALLASSSEDD